MFFRVSFSLRLFFVSCIENFFFWHEMYFEEEGEIISLKKRRFFKKDCGDFAELNFFHVLW